MSMISTADALFSKTQQKVLGLLFGNPAQRFYTNEIIRRVAMGRGTVTRELDRLRAADIVSLIPEGKQKYYQANPDSPVFDTLTALVAKLNQDAKLHANNDSLRIIVGGKAVPHGALQKIAKQFHIKKMSLFGSAARSDVRPDSDIDLLVEFEHNQTPSLSRLIALQDVLKKLFGGREVDIATPSIMNNPYRKQAIEKDLKELYVA